MEKEVLFEKEKNIAIITFNRPQRYNAVNQDLVDGINDSLSIVENDNDIRAVVLTGNGKGFCSGADMSVFGGKVSSEQRRDYIVEQYQPLMNRFFKIKKPVIGSFVFLPRNKLKKKIINIDAKYLKIPNPFDPFFKRLLLPMTISRFLFINLL